MIRVGIAADHGGFALKGQMADLLRGSGYIVVDFGAHQLDPEDDYTDFIIPLAKAIATGEVERGVALCGSGVGASIAANVDLAKQAGRPLFVLAARLPLPPPPWHNHGASMTGPFTPRTLPAFIKPMLASRGTPFDDESCLFEIKWNGIRMLAFVETPGYRLVNRHAVDTTSRYPEFAVLAELPSGTVLDGEMVVFRDGQPDLALLQGRDKTRSALKTRTGSQAQPATFVAFDLLYEKLAPLLDRPLQERRERLERLLRSWSHPRLVLSQGIVSHGRMLFAETCRQNLEGLMAKRLASPYRAGLFLVDRRRRKRLGQLPKGRPGQTSQHKLIAYSHSLQCTKGMTIDAPDKTRVLSGRASDGH